MMFEEKAEAWAVVAVVLAFAIVGVVAVQTLMVPQIAEARGCESSLPNSGGGFVGLNASKGRCFGH